MVMVVTGTAGTLALATAVFLSWRRARALEQRTERLLRRINAEIDALARRAA